MQFGKRRAKCPETNRRGGHFSMARDAPWPPRRQFRETLINSNRVAAFSPRDTGVYIKPGIPFPVP